MRRRLGVSRLYASVDSSNVSARLMLMKQTLNGLSLQISGVSYGVRDEWIDEEGQVHGRFSVGTEVELRDEHVGGWRR